MSDDVQDGSYLQCVAGHYFDSRLRKVCPVCGAGPAAVPGTAVYPAVSLPPEAPPDPVPGDNSASVGQLHRVPDAVRVPDSPPVADASYVPLQVPPPSPSLPLIDPVKSVGPPPVQAPRQTLVKCPNGHLYDAKANPTCPECAAIQPKSSRWARYVYILVGAATAVIVCIILWPHLKSANPRPAQSPGSSTGIGTVPASLPVIETLDAVPAEVNSGGAATLRWSTSNASEIEIDNGVGGVAGQQTLVHPAATTLYTVKASNQGNSTSRSILVTVRPSSTPQPAIDAFTVQPATINKGQKAVLQWSVHNTSSISIDNGIGPTPGNQVKVSPESTATYTITASNSVASVTRTVTLNVNAPPPPRAVIEAFAATPGKIVSGQSAVLHWSARNATALSLDNSIGGVTGDQITVHPATTTTYTLVATGDTSSDSRSVVITVTEPAPVVRTQPQSGVLRCQNVTVAPFGQVVFEHLPGGRLHFEVEPAGAWLILPQKQPDGTQKLILISRLAQPQTSCTVRWEIAK